MMRHKFNAVRTVVDGIKFSSKKEAKRYEELEILRKTGKVSMFLRQTPFHLRMEDNEITKYVADFVVFWADGSCTVEDVKGMRTDVYRLKKKMVEAQYPVRIVEK